MLFFTLSATCVLLFSSRAFLHGGLTGGANDSVEEVLLQEKVGRGQAGEGGNAAGARKATVPAHQLTCKNKRRGHELSIGEMQWDDVGSDRKGVCQVNMRQRRETGQRDAMK